MSSVHKTAQAGYTQSADLYQIVRPNYPDQVVPWLNKDLGINQHSNVIDLGTGTGKFLPYIQQVTSHITAIDPVEAMLTELSKKYPDIKVLQAYSSKIPLTSLSVDAIICAQSFHWFSNQETLQELHRLLKPSAPLGLVWNQRDFSIDWVRAVEDLVEEYQGDTPRYYTGQWQQVLEDQSLFKLNKLSTYPNPHHGTVEDVVSKRFLSSSFIAALAADKQSELKQQFEKIVFDYTGKRAHDPIEMPYVTYAYHYIKV